MTDDLKRLLAAWDQIANRNLDTPIPSPTVSVERGALRQLLAAVRVELPA